MDLGTCQAGLMVTDMALAARIGVCLSGAPTTTRDVSADWPDSISTSEASGTLTRIYWSPRLCGIHRSRSILAAICYERAAAGTFSIWAVRSFKSPSTVKPQTKRKAFSAAAIADGVTLAEP